MLLSSAVPASCAGSEGGRGSAVQGTRGEAGGVGWGSGWGAAWGKAGQCRRAGRGGGHLRLCRGLIAQHGAAAMVPTRQRAAHVGQTGPAHWLPPQTDGCAAPFSLCMPLLLTSLVCALFAGQLPACLSAHVSITRCVFKPACLPACTTMPAHLLCKLLALAAASGTRQALAANLVDKLGCDCRTGWSSNRKGSVTFEPSTRWVGRCTEAEHVQEHARGQAGAQPTCQDNIPLTCLCCAEQHIKTPANASHTGGSAYPRTSQSSSSYAGSAPTSTPTGAGASSRPTHRPTQVETIAPAHAPVKTPVSTSVDSSNSTCTARRDAYSYTTDRGVLASCPRALQCRKSWCSRGLTGVVRG